MSAQNKNKIAYFKKLLKEYDEACQHMAFKGSRHPDEWDDIDEFYKDTKTKVIGYFAKNVS